MEEEMLRELLLALLGYIGDLIVDDRERRQSLAVPLPSDTPISDDCTFRLSPDISILDPSDMDLIELLIALGFYYRELDRFATVSRNLSWIRSANAAAAASPLKRCSELAKRKDERPSVYRRAIAHGIAEILSVYRSVVLQIELKLLSETLPILAMVTQALNKFFVLLPPLYELIVKIEREDIRGGQLRTFCTNGAIVEFLNCRRVFRGFCGMDTKSCTTNWLLGWSMVYFRTSMENFSLEAWERSSRFEKEGYHCTSAVFLQRWVVSTSAKHASGENGSMCKSIFKSASHSLSCGDAFLPEWRT